MTEICRKTPESWISIFPIQKPPFLLLLRLLFQILPPLKKQLWILDVSLLLLHHPNLLWNLPSIPPEKPAENRYRIDCRCRNESETGIVISARFRRLLLLLVALLRLISPDCL